MNDRQKKILQKLKKNGHISITEESKTFGVNEMTIRRDLTALEKIGEATRVHGGAIPRSPMPGGLDFMTAPPREAQIAIAKETVKHLPPNSSVMLNTGTTVLQVAREIAAAELQLNIITNSLAVAIALYRTPCQVLLTGGTLRQKWVDLAGPMTLKNIDEFNVDILITGCDAALADEGVFTSDINLAEIERKAVEKSNQVIVVTESTKFGKKDFAKFATIDEVDMVITDRELSASINQQLQKNKLNVIAI